MASKEEVIARLEYLIDLGLWGNLTDKDKQEIKQLKKDLDKILKEENKMVKQPSKKRDPFMAFLSYDYPEKARKLRGKK